MTKLKVKNFGMALVGAIVFASALSACGKSNSGGTGTSCGSAAVNYTPGLASCPAGQGRIGAGPCVDKTNFNYACSVSGGTMQGSVCRITVPVNVSGQGSAAYLGSNPAPLTTMNIPVFVGDSMYVSNATVTLGDISTNSGSWGPFQWNFSNGFQCNNQVATTLSLRETNGSIHSLNSGTTFTFASAGNLASLMTGINAAYTANKCMKVTSFSAQLVHCEVQSGQTVSCQ